MLGMVYFAPENPKYKTGDYFAVLCEELTSLPDNVDVLICGDFNARTSNFPDYLEPTHEDGSDGGLSTLLPNEACQTFDHMFCEHLMNNKALHRASKDAKRTNKYGKQLLSFCQSTNFFIVNWRKVLDKCIGEYTRIDTTGKSVVDYLLATPVTYQFIKDFHVHPKLPESDHMPVFFTIMWKTELTHSTSHKKCSWWYPTIDFAGIKKIWITC